MNSEQADVRRPWLTALLMADMRASGDPSNRH